MSISGARIDLHSGFFEILFAQQITIFLQISNNFFTHEMIGGVKWIEKEHP